MFKPFQKGIIALHEGREVYRLMPETYRGGQQEGWAIQTFEDGKWTSQVWEPELEVLMTYLTRIMGTDYEQLVLDDDLLVA